MKQIVVSMGCQVNLTNTIVGGLKAIMAQWS
jgi:hypothetical protein